MSAADDLHPDLQALVGTVIHDRYRVDTLLGRGGMGAVFRAHHLGLRRDVAFKVLRPELGRDVSTGKRFEREAHSVSRLDHPNCVRVTDFGTTEGGVKYLVMELLEGAELEASLGQPLPPARAVELIIQILEGLEHAHHVGVVHRDLKPENVFVTRDYRGRELVKLVDFGIAKLIDEQGAKDQLTRAGTIFGTPRYMSPEQASGGKLDERTDLYAAGLILYEMLTGRPPFVSDDAAALLRMHILAPPPELPASVPAPLAAVVNKLLEKSRNDRYASARETIDALQQIQPVLTSAAPAVAVGPALTGPSSTPSMATSFEPSTKGGLSWSPDAPPTSGRSWSPDAPPSVAGLPAAAPVPIPPPGAPLPPAAPMPPAAGAPGLAFPSGPIAPPPAPPQVGAPAYTPGMPTSTPAPGMPPAPVHAPTSGFGAPANAPTSGFGAPTDGSSTSAAITHYDPLPITQPPPPTSRRWLPWAIGGGALMLALMAFGAGQALQSSSSNRDRADARTDAPKGSPPSSAAPPAASALDGREFDNDCSDGVCECRDQASCEISCGRGCMLRCVDSDRCALEVDSGSTVRCERVGSCDVNCLGDCRVECPQGGCTVQCPHPGDKRGKKKKPKPATRCGDVYLCGSDCDD